MKSDKQKHYLGITGKDGTIFEKWITDEQKTIIENHIGVSDTFGYNVHIEEIIETVCGYFNEPIDILGQRTRAAEVVRCRQLYFYFFVKKLNYSTIRAGKIFNLDHAMVIHAIKKVAAKYTNDVIEIDRILSRK